MEEFSSTSALSETLQQRLLKLLHEGEHLLWAARPDGDDYQDNKGVIQLFGVFWLLFTGTILAILFPHRMGGSGLVPPPYGYYSLIVIFMSIGIYLVTISFWSTFFAARTLYVITNKRIVLLGFWFRGSFAKSFEGKAVRRVKVRKRENGTGDIILMRFKLEDKESGDSVEEIGFFNIPNVTRLRPLIDSLKKQPNR